MRKVFVLAAAVAAAARFLVAGTASAEAAYVFRADGSGWFDGNGNLVIVPDANVQYVFTNNADGSYNVRVKGTLPDGSALPKKTMHFTDESTGFFCATPGDSFKGVTTPSGQFSYECKGDGFPFPKP
jgi:hypothetical protein